MRGRWALIAAVLLVSAAPAAAADRPLFEFRGEVPAPGGLLRLEARCTRASRDITCRVGGTAPSGRDFGVEWRVYAAPPPPPGLERTGRDPGAPRWF